MGVFSNKISTDELKPGDHIYSWRLAYAYAHHGIYVGDGKVIHFTRGAGQEIGTGTSLDNIILSSIPSHGDNPCPDCGDQSNLDGVISSCLECFLSGGDLYIFEYSVSLALFLAKPRGGTCSLAVSDPPEDVIHRAKFLLQNGFGIYNIFKNNCEDFAIYCKTGLVIYTNMSVGRSGQAASLLEAAKAAFSSSLSYLTTGVSGAAVSYGKYSVGRLISDTGVRSDVKKVAVETLFAQPQAVATEMAKEGICEEFAIYCIMGLLVYRNMSIGRSGRAASLFAAASAVVSSPLWYLTAGVIGLPVVSYGVYSVGRLISDIWVRRGVNKVAVETLVAQPQAVATEMAKEGKQDDKTC